jgi:hypothetical protein
MEELMMQPDERERDKYGNTEDDFQNCSFPDCGCDGARLCMAPNGAHEGALILNLEKMPYELRCRLNQEKEPTK